MMALWGAIALLTLIAVAVVFLPLLRAGRLARRDEAEDRQHQNIDIYRERLAELESERASGTLDDDNFEVLKLELERNLLIDAEDNRTPVLKAVRPGAAQLTTVVLLALLIPVAAIGLYDRIGRADDLERAMNPPQMPTLEQAIAELKRELEANPDNAEGWYLLGTTYVNQGRFDEGLDAFRRVAEILPPEAPQYAGVQGQIAQALYFQAGGMTDQVRAQIEHTLALDPNDMAALGLLGIDAYEQADYRAAIEYWSHALDNASGQAAQSLRAGIEQAKEQLIAAGEALPDLPQAAAASIRVSITLADELKAQVSPDQTLFVYARPVGGRMPLAAVRHRVADLPLEVVLDDSLAMMPGAELSSVDRVEVGARISATGQAAAAPGDLIGSVAPVETATPGQRVELVIDRVVE